MKNKYLIGLSILCVCLSFCINVSSKDNKVDNAKTIVHEKENPIWKEVELCNYDNSVKNYMDYRTITDIDSKQYQIVNDAKNFNGLLYYNGAICVALGSIYGDVGTIYKITLESGRELLIIKADEKSDRHTINGCNNTNGSILELIVNTDSMDETVKIMGDYDYSELLHGKIVKMETGGY